MLSERAVYLAKNDNDKGNGFYDRKLATPASSLEISVPRTRYFQFPTFYPLLPATKELIVFLLTCLCRKYANGYS